MSSNFEINLCELISILKVQKFPSLPSGTKINKHNLSIFLQYFFIFSFFRFIQACSSSNGLNLTSPALFT